MENKEAEEAKAKLATMSDESVLRNFMKCCENYLSGKYTLGDICVMIAFEEEIKKRNIA